MTKMLEILLNNRKVRASTLVKRCDVPRSEGTVKHILDVDNIETSNMTLTMDDGTCTAHVTPTSDHDKVTSVKFDEIGDLPGRQVELDSVVDCTVVRL